VKNLSKTFVWFILSMLVLLVPLAAGAQPISDAIFSLAWSPDGTRIASGHREGIVKIWDATTGTLLTTYQLPNPANPSRYLQIMDELEWSPDSTRIAVGEMREVPFGFMFVMDAATGNIISSAQTQDFAADLSWSPDGTRIAATAQSISQLAYRDAWLILDASTGAQLFRLDSPELQGVKHLDWSPDGSRIATGGNLNNLAQIWDANSGTLLMTLEGHTENTSFIRWNSDGTRIATFGQDDTLRIWDVVTGQNIQTASFPYPHPYPRDIAWQPNSDQLALVFDTSIEIIDTVTGQTVNTLPGGGVAAWSPEGTRMVTVLDSQVTIVDATTGNPVPTATPVYTATPTDIPTIAPSLSPRAIQQG
jgi:WD40 repeat protein